MRMVEGFRRITWGSILSAGFTQVLGGGNKTYIALESQLQKETARYVQGCIIQTSASLRWFWSTYKSGIQR